MSTRITASLVVCVAAAGVAVGALALESGDTEAPQAGESVAATEATGGYGAADDAGAVADGGTPAGTTVEIQGMTFSAATVAPGGEVTVVNADEVPHTVTADGGEFDSGEVEGGGTTTFQAPSEPGTYPFFCQIHPGMTGTLTVVG